MHIKEKKHKIKDLITIIATALAVILATFHIYTGVAGLMYTYIQRGIHLGLILIITILGYLNKEEKSQLFNVCMLLATIISFAYLFLNMDYILTRLWGAPLTYLDVVTGVLLFAVVLIMGIRIIGWALPIVMLLSVGYGFFGQYLSGIFQHGGYSWRFMLELTTWSEMGIFSQPLGVSATYLYMFVLFGALIDKMGTGSTLMDLAKILAGRQKGGPAKVAIFSSAMMGTISGSPTANVLTTGTFTIPLMVKLGFEKAYAGAVEAVASTGGMILPPVMGVLAFAMVDYSGIPYFNIVKSAAIPAILYFLAVFTTIHLHAHKLDMKILDISNMSSATTLLKDQWCTLIPILILTVPLIMGYTPLLTVSWAILLLVPISFLNRDSSRWLTPKRLVTAFTDAARNIAMVAIPCTLAGIVAGVLGVTGVGVRLSSVLLEIANGNLLILLILVAFITLIMGTGLPSLLAYLIQIPVTIPALVQMGIPTIGAHLFVVYYSTLSFITPPIGASLYAAMAISKASLSKIGKEAVLVGMAAFLIPFMFVYNPALLLLESFSLKTIHIILTSVLGVVLLSICNEGFLFQRLSWFVRLIFGAAALALISPNSIVGMITIPIIIIMTLNLKRLAIISVTKVEFKKSNSFE
ncbi:TRAP transporter permease [Alkalibaculum sporogenes]|uniref:TRAP transporter permease n=1 Tax=Alkalibaculum sporogenes TaxID=2655001 RepID=UPI00187B38AF|nr:TRAP transporter fused permease subunit [Alkalibaculum sporogenes]